LKKKERRSQNHFSLFLFHFSLFAFFLLAGEKKRFHFWKKTVEREEKTSEREEKRRPRGKNKQLKKMKPTVRAHAFQVSLV